MSAAPTSSPLVAAGTSCGLVIELPFVGTWGMGTTGDREAVAGSPFGEARPERGMSSCCSCRDRRSLSRVAARRPDAALAAPGRGSPASSLVPAGHDAAVYVPDGSGHPAGFLGEEKRD